MVKQYIAFEITASVLDCTDRCGDSAEFSQRLNLQNCAV